MAHCKKLSVRIFLKSFNLQRAPNSRDSRSQIKVIICNSVKWRLKVSGGVPLFRDHPLPVSLDAHLITSFVEANELIKTAFLMMSNSTSGFEI